MTVKLGRCTILCGGAPFEIDEPIPGHYLVRVLPNGSSTTADVSKGIDVARVGLVEITYERIRERPWAWAEINRKDITERVYQSKKDSFRRILEQIARS